MRLAKGSGIPDVEHAVDGCSVILNDEGDEQNDDVARHNIEVEVVAGDVDGSLVSRW